MKRTLAVCLCAALLLCLLAGCTEEIPEYIPTGGALDSDTPHTRPTTDPQKPEEKQISLAYNAEAGMNPLLTMSFTNRMLFTLIYQGLFTVNNEYECSPILCKNYNVTSDMKTYTFYLEEAYFSDGTALTAADVVASLEAARSSDYYGGRLQHVDSITAYGDVVVIELDTPMENLPILLDIPIIKADEIEAEQPLGTGPYRVDGEKLKRQAGWWCTASLRISCDEIPLVNCTSAAQVRDAFELGGVGMACADQAVYNRIPYHGDYELWDCENGLFLYLGCNSKSEIFSNEAVRSTLTYAIGTSWWRPITAALPTALPCRHRPCRLTTAAHWLAGMTMSPSVFTMRWPSPAYWKMCRKVKSGSCGCWSIPMTVCGWQWRRKSPGCWRRPALL